jgi:DNA-binding protein YbaB
MTEEKKSEELLSNIKDSVQQMQGKMTETYKSLSEKQEDGFSDDETVKISMYADYSLRDIEFGKEALDGGVKEFKLRIHEAWKDVLGKIQKATQEKTMELLQNMQIPEEMQNLSIDDKDDD